MLGVPAVIQALCEWMEEEAAAGRRGMHALPVFYLLRGRVAEGLHANACLSRTPPAEGALFLVTQLVNNDACCGTQCTFRKVFPCSIE